MIFMVRLMTAGLKMASWPWLKASMVSSGCTSIALSEPGKN